MAQSIVSLRAAWQGWLKVLVAGVRTASGEEVQREFVERPPAVAVLPYDAARRLAMLVRSPRPAVMHAGGPGLLLEAPAGIMEDDSPEDCARREAMEETGVRLGALEPVGGAYASPGMSSELIHLFLAPYAAADRVGEGGGLAGEHEEIETVELPLAELAALVDTGRVEDMKTLALVQSLRLRKPELFA